MRLVHGVATVAAVETCAHFRECLPQLVVILAWPRDAAVVLVVEVDLGLQTERVTEVAVLAGAGGVSAWAWHDLNELVVEVVDAGAHRNPGALLDLHTQ